jgi:hypothetical protein
MTRDEAIPMLCVACGVSPASADINVTALHSIVDKLIAAEREACALIAESYEPTCESCPSGVANAIRHRGIKDDRDTESN